MLLLTRQGTKEVYVGESLLYGSVILKRNADLRELQGEYRMLSRLGGALAYCVRNQVPAEFLGMARKTREICEELFRKYPERMLLHGDLHHDNLLQRANGSYAMIDPKGIVGPEILEQPRFLLNEMEAPYEGNLCEHMERIIRRMAEEFVYPAEEPGKAFYMETVLANAWSLEDGEKRKWDKSDLRPGL